MTEPEQAERRAAEERDLCGLVSGAARRIEEQVRAHAAALGLTGPQAVALRELTGPLPMGELADRMSCEPSNATFIVDRLEKLGLVRRHAVAHDRRIKELVLTQAGTDLRSRLLELLAVGSPLAGLSAREQDVLRELLSRVAATRDG